MYPRLRRLSKIIEAGPHVLRVAHDPPVEALTKPALGQIAAVSS